MVAGTLHGYVYGRWPEQYIRFFRRLAPWMSPRAKQIWADHSICNGCTFCCAGLEAMTRHGVPMVASSGFVAQVDEGSCIGCGDCEEACPFHAIHVPYRAEVTWASCMGCGVCEGRCATGAVTLVRDEGKGIPLDVRALAWARDPPSMSPPGIDWSAWPIRAVASP